jgi:type VI secretion system secreted protein Hcp
MALEMYLRMDGIQGLSKNFSFKDSSEITEFSWGMLSNRKSAKVNESDMTAFGEITVSKQIGLDSAAIMLHYAQGKIISSADITVIPVALKREAQKRYLNIHMEEVLVKSILTGGDISQDVFGEKITLLFGKVKFEYDYNPPITAKTTEIQEFSFSWDITHNTSIQ